MPEGVKIKTEDETSSLICMFDFIYCLQESDSPSAWTLTSMYSMASRCLHSVSTVHRRCSPLLWTARQSTSQPMTPTQTVRTIQACGCSPQPARKTTRQVPPHVCSEHRSVATRATEAQVTGEHIQQRLTCSPIHIQYTLCKLQLPACISRGCSCGRRLVGSTETGHSCWQGHISRAASRR